MTLNVVEPSVRRSLCVLLWIASHICRDSEKNNFYGNNGHKLFIFPHENKNYLFSDRV